MLNAGDTIEGVVRRVLLNAENEQCGLIVEIPGTAFVPRTLLPEQYKVSMEQLVGKAFAGIVFRIDSERNTAIVQLTSIEQ